MAVSKVVLCSSINSMAVSKVALCLSINNMAVSKVALCSSINNMAVAKEEEEEEEEAADWSNLSYHLLDLIMDSLICPSISDHFNSSIDYNCFGSVCMSWRSAFNVHNPRLLPLLMVPPSFEIFTYINDLSSYRAIENKKKKNKKMKQLRLRGFYSILNQKVDDRLMVRMPNYQQCRGSSHGWLITVDDIEDYFRVQLFNPFTGDAIVLPPLQSIKSASHVFDFNYLGKAILSTDPVANPTEYMVMIIYGSSKKLALLKPGDKTWTRIKSPRIETLKKGGWFEDIIYYQGKFFAINTEGTIVVVCDDVAESMTARVLLQPPPIGPKRSNIRKNIVSSIRRYIVESLGGSLLQVHRVTEIKISNKAYATIGFRVFKLLHQTIKLVHQISTEEDYEWVELKNLCGDAMFLGHNESMSIPAKDYPGCRPNCIYYTDDSDSCIEDPLHGPYDIGVFNLEEGSFERYFPGKKKSLTFVSIWPVPIWIQPSLKSTTSSILSNQNDL